MREFPKFRVKAVHPYAWLWESLEGEPSFVLRAMFGAKAVYLHGKLQLCFTAKSEPWRGVLVCTEKCNHRSLMDAFPALAPHPVLPKWLYLPESNDAFEFTATRLVDSVRKRDPRVGVIPRTRKCKRR